MDYGYRGHFPCFKCDGERGDSSKGFAWTRPADNSMPWWPTKPCNVCGGTGHRRGSYITFEEYAATRKATLAKMRARLEYQEGRLSTLGFK